MDHLSNISSEIKFYMLNPLIKAFILSGSLPLSYSRYGNFDSFTEYKTVLLINKSKKYKQIEDCAHDWDNHLSKSKYPFLQDVGRNMVTKPYKKYIKNINKEDLYYFSIDNLAEKIIINNDSNYYSLGITLFYSKDFNISLGYIKNILDDKSLYSVEQIITTLTLGSLDYTCIDNLKATIGYK